MMASNASSSQPTCQNCSTSTTPLWRRDEFGSVLCNACGLFLKLHGRPRPISLKTDVIKSRNRVKTMRTDLAPKKKVRWDPIGTHALCALQCRNKAQPFSYTLRRSPLVVAGWLIQRTSRTMRKVIRQPGESRQTAIWMDMIPRFHEQELPAPCTTRP